MYTSFEIMAFALVNFYKENTWDIIPYSDIILNDKHKGEDALELEGVKTLVVWKDSKGKPIKAVAQIIKISG